MFFRPIPGITVAVAGAAGDAAGPRRLAVCRSRCCWRCCWASGVWQLQRLQWKLALIEQVDRNMAAPPISLNQALRLGPDAQYRRVMLTGRYDNAKEAYLYGIGPEGAPVFHVVVPFTADDRRVLLVDRGIVPARHEEPGDPPSAGLIFGRTAVTAVWRNEEMPGLFHPRRPIPSGASGSCAAPAASPVSTMCGWRRPRSWRRTPRPMPAAGRAAADRGRLPQRAPAICDHLVPDGGGPAGRVCRLSCLQGPAGLETARVNPNMPSPGLPRRAVSPRQERRGRGDPL
ncbi:MAG: SURF1 family protein [Rhizomicrobium sp.]